MKPLKPVLICLITLSQNLYAQKNVTIYELKGKVDVSNDITIEKLPTKGQNDSALIELRKINSIINEYKGRSVNVLNGLSNIGLQLFNTVYINDCGKNSLYDRIIIYYLKKETP